VAAGWRGWIAGRTGLALWSALIPFVLLDHFAYSVPMGMIIFGIWLGVIELLARDREQDQDRDRDRAVSPLPEAHASGRESHPEGEPHTRSAGR